MTLPADPSAPPIRLVSAQIDESAVVRSHPTGSELPLVLLLHGLGSHERDLTGFVPHLPNRFQYASLRGIHAWVQGYAWLEAQIDPAAPEALERSAAAVEAWIAGRAAEGVRTRGAIGFSQGGMLALQLLRRRPEALDWIVQLSGAPFPAPMPGDAALAARRPPALWGHGGLDPLFDAAREQEVRTFMTAHTDLVEERSPYLGHGVDEQVLAAVRRFLDAAPER
ncbi:alpha/beta hydrolase [Brachybacterium hainanense]|uniref:Alpha/beta hydrolase n=1 Tax=Brachybacterium hainanense TaxID=1541174 RepID=A0ABV6RFX4_9MICO